VSDLDLAAAKRAEVAARSRSRRRWLSVIISPPVLAGLLVAVGAALRLYHLGGRSFWLDEVYTSQASQLPTLSQVVDWSRAWQLQPLYFAAAWISAHLSAGGDSETALRLPAALAGALTVYYGYRLGRTLYTPAVGLISAMLFATLFFPVWYSQEARPYAFMILLATVQILYAYRSVRDSRVRDWLGLAVVTLLALYNHYMALLPTAACAVFVGGALATELAAAWRARDRPGAQRALIKLVAAADAGALVLLGYLPWLRYVVAFLKGGSISSDGYFLRFPAHRFQLAEVTTFLWGFGFQGILVLLLAVGIAATVLRARRGGATAGGLLLLSLAVPLLVLGFKIGEAVLGVWARYLAFLLPTGIVLVALGAEELALAVASAYGRLTRRVSTGTATPVARLAVVAIAAAVAAQSLSGLIPSYGYQKDDYRAAVSHVLSHGSTNDVIFSIGEATGFLDEGLPYYARRTHSHLLVADGHALAFYGRLIPDRLRQPGAQVWLAAANGDDSGGIRARFMISAGFHYTALPPVTDGRVEVTRYEGITLARVRQVGLSPIQQVTVLFRWAARAQSSLLPQLSQLLAEESQAARGRPPPG
jgi:4-amino-4-deoxy-L-arabinose transferase-like glycosyltransferase